MREVVDRDDAQWFSRPTVITSPTDQFGTAVTSIAGSGGWPSGSFSGSETCADDTGARGIGTSWTVVANRPVVPRAMA